MILPLNRDLAALADESLQLSRYGLGELVRRLAYYGLHDPEIACLSGLSKCLVREVLATKGACGTSQ